MIPTYDARLEDPVTGEHVRIEAGSVAELDQRVEAFYTTAAALTSPLRRASSA